TWHRNEEFITEQGHVTDLIAKEAIQWLEKRGDDKPFFLYVPFTAVHLPIREPETWMARVPKEISGEVPRHYAACILHLDDAVGRIVDAVNKAGKSDNTLIVFTSDNGGSTAENNDTKYPDDNCPNGKLTGNNLPLRGQKGDLYEGGTRVPTIVRWPGKIKAESSCEAAVHIVDWMPTLCDLAGSKADATKLKWDGVNIWPVISGTGSLAARSLYSAGTSFRSRALRQGDWKLILFAGRDGTEGKVELFNLAKDPNEKNDLAESNPDKTAAMKRDLQAASATDRDALASGDEGV
ncbi:MAG: sulfatase-like hydrolase/transferase, partial [Planctomycetia bacterium]|nr:sulfatase-like hydrolase/transferase [Planctomycetia bacterium]